MEEKKYAMCKIFYLQLYIFAVWESDKENHLSMLFLKLRRDFVVRSSSEISFYIDAPL